MTSIAIVLLPVFFILLIIFGKVTLLTRKAERDEKIFLKFATFSQEWESNE
jgi:hypothetical protein